MGTDFKLFLLPYGNETKPTGLGVNDVSIRAVNWQIVSTVAPQFNGYSIVLFSKGNLLICYDCDAV